MLGINESTQSKRIPMKVFSIVLGLGLALLLSTAFASSAFASAPAKGTTFIVKGSTYKVIKPCTDTDHGTVELLKYGGTSKKISFLSDNVWSPIQVIGNDAYWYDVTAIGENAFNTTQGKKVTNLEIGTTVNTIKKGAFKNMKSLKELSALGSPAFAFKCKSIAKGAFSNTGKNSGKGLTVYVGLAKNKKTALKLEPTYKKLLVKRGLSKNSKVEFYY